MSEEQASEEHAGNAPEPETDGVVNAHWSVAVIPNENVSIHYSVAPVNAEDAVTSVTTSFVLMKDHMIQDTFAGSTMQDLVAPKAGQGSVGDTGVDSTVFPAEPDGQLTAVLSGTARQGENTVNFFFSKDFDPKA